MEASSFGLVVVHSRPVTIYSIKFTRSAYPVPPRYTEADAARYKASAIDTVQGYLTCHCVDGDSPVGANYLSIHFIIAEIAISTGRSGRSSSVTFVQQLTNYSIYRNKFFVNVLRSESFRPKQTIFDRTLFQYGCQVIARTATFAYTQKILNDSLL